jgi:hypothetical protein
MYYYRYQPYSYRRRYYNPYYNYMQNIISSQVAEVDQSMVNYGSMANVSQDSVINQTTTSLKNPTEI